MSANDKRSSSSSLDEKHANQHYESTTPPAGVEKAAQRKLANPLAGLSDAQVLEMADKFARDNGLEDAQDDIRKGALVSKDPAHFEGIDMLTEEDKEALRREITHKGPFSIFSFIV
ncbi:hypothetical protein MPER_15484 [Moniliophthora perniciosa FA553]|nr:hypothetical protein MPER_15484 [Moniliophthora perniciosa FA553]